MAPVEVTTVTPAAEAVVEASAIEEKADGIQKEREGTDSPAESAPMPKTRFAKFFCMCTKGRSQEPESAREPPVPAKSCLKKQKTTTLEDSTEDAEQPEAASGSTELDGTDGDQKVTSTTSDGRPSDPALMLDTPSEPAPLSNAEGTETAAEPAIVRKSCLMKCLSVCTKRRTAAAMPMRTAMSMMMHQSTTVPDGSDDEQTVAPPVAEGTDSATPDAQSTDTPTAPAPSKRPCFMKCFIVCLCCQPVMLCFRRCSTFLFKCPCITCARICKMRKTSQALKPASIVPLGDESGEESALDIEQGTTALDFRTVHLGDENEKPFVIENVPTVSGTPVDVVMRNGAFAAGCRAKTETIDAATPGGAVVAA